MTAPDVSGGPTLLKKGFLSGDKYRKNGRQGGNNSTEIKSRDTQKTIKVLSYAGGNSNRAEGVLEPSKPTSDQPRNVFKSGKEKKFSFRVAGLYAIAKQRMMLPKEDRKLYSPVQFEVDYPPQNMPFMGAGARKIGKYKRIPTETVAVKQNDVQDVKLDRLTQGIVRRKKNAKREIARTLVMWHMDLDRKTLLKDPALERRTDRIVKFIDNMSDDFHFTRSFYIDMANPDIFSSTKPQPQPSTKPLYASQPLYATQPPPQPVCPPQPSTQPLCPPESSTQPLCPPQPPTTPPPTFSHNLRKRNNKFSRMFAECSKANEISGYTYVKVYTDPYYRYLPPLSAASKKFEMRLARLPYKHVRNETEWKNFLEELKKPPKVLVKLPPSRTESPNYGELAKEKVEVFRKKLPIISILPSWLTSDRDVVDRNKGLTDTDDCFDMKKENSFIGFTN